MNKNEQNRVVAWRLKLLRRAIEMPGGVAQTCRHLGLSRKAFYKWRARYRSHGQAGLRDRPRIQTCICARAWTHFPLEARGPCANRARGVLSVTSSNPKPGFE